MQKTLDEVNEKLSLYVSRDKEKRKPTYTLKNRYCMHISLFLSLSLFCLLWRTSAASYHLTSFPYSLLLFSPLFAFLSLFPLVVFWPRCKQRETTATTMIRSLFAL